MNSSFRMIDANDVNLALEEVIYDGLVEILGSRQPGHCMKITNLDTELMYSLCKRLKNTFTSFMFYILSPETESKEELRISSTKLVELRNPLKDGSLREPLLVFIPNDVRTSSEDSFGVATFEEISFNYAYKQLHESLVNSFPLSIRTIIREIFYQLNENAWRWADIIAQIRYLLTLKKNDTDNEVIGAALYELGLVPDLKLVEGETVSAGRLIRNLNCLNTLTFSQKSERVRILDLGLVNYSFQAYLAEYLTAQGLETPTRWTRNIILEGDRDRKFWFDKWEFIDGGVIEEQLFIEVSELVLPSVDLAESDTKLQSLIGQQVLAVGPRGHNKLTIVFSSTPAPQQLKDFDRFELQILTKEGIPVGITKQKKPSAKIQNKYRVNFLKLNSSEWSEGWYYIKVTAYNKNGDPFPLIDDQGKPLPYYSDGIQGERSKFPNESDLFYVMQGDEYESEMQQRAIPRYPSLVHAVTQLRFSAINSGRNPNDLKISHVSWLKDSESRGLQQNDIAQVKFSREGLVNIPISSTLHQLEQNILSNPIEPLIWNIKFIDGIVRDISSNRFEWPVSEGMTRFLEARKQYFSKVAVEIEGSIIENISVKGIQNYLIEYVESFCEVVRALLRTAEISNVHKEHRHLQDLQKLISLDSINVNITDHRGNNRSAVLLGPTHPLRALWINTWECLSYNWTESSVTAEKEHILPTKDALLKGISIVNFPAVIPLELGQLLIGIDNIHPFWTIYSTPGEEDPRGLVGQICTSMGIEEPVSGGFFIDGDYLANRIRRYIAQHPYVDTIIINVFNAGRGRIIAETLLTLQRYPDLAELKYNIRLFVSDPDLPETGQDIEDLLLDGKQTNIKEADAFSAATGSHLFPKLSLALRSINDFRNSSTDYYSHLTILFDIFPPQEISAESSTIESECSPIHGLFQDFEILYSDAGEDIGWRRRPRHGLATPLEGSEELSELLSRASALTSNVSAAIATGLIGPKLLPVIRLALSSQDKALVHQVHEVSDWVFIIDRNMGIEYFDHNGAHNRPEYLIDHSPGINGIGNRRMVITSRSVSEVEAFLETVLNEHGLPVDKNRALAVLTQLRSLSGRLVLKLVSSPNARSEALGLAIARMYLDYQGVLKNQIILPLDSHLELYKILKRDYDEIGNDVSLKRTDLALFDLDAAKSEITCNLIEVKCYSDVGNIGTYHKLMDDISLQIRQTENVLKYHYDPNSCTKDRPDRLFKNQEFVAMLEFYLDRSMRFGILSHEVWNEAKSLFRNLEFGYSLKFTQSAIIFDFGKNGTEISRSSDGIEFHRIGADLIKELLDALPSMGDLKITSTEATNQESYYSLGISDESLSKLESTIPKLLKASFISKKRDHTTTWLKNQIIAHPIPEQKDKEQITNVIIEVEETLVEQFENQTEKGVMDEGVDKNNEGDNIVNEHVTVIKDVSETSNGVPSCDIFIGDTDKSMQYGIIGKVAGRTIGLDLNHPQTISLFGVQGGGKSYTLGSIVEMATMMIPQINSLSSPLASVIFHFSTTQDYRPEFTSMCRPNQDSETLKNLMNEYGAQGRALDDIVLLTPIDKLEERKKEFPELIILPLKFQSSELGASHWRFLMGAVGNQATYIRQLNHLMRQLRGNITLASLRQGIQDLVLPDHVKNLANMRLDLAATYIDDNARLSDILKPGRMVIVDLRDEFIEKDEALGLFVVLLQLFADTKYEGRSFNKLIVFDEAHKYIDSPDLVDGLVEVVREMRHKGTSVLVASQDPPSVPISLIELSTQIILHRFNSPAWLKHIQKANSSLSNLTSEHMSNLKIGEAYIWSSKSTDVTFSRNAIKIQCRPRITEHGGATKTAID